MTRFFRGLRIPAVGLRLRDQAVYPDSGVQRTQRTFLTSLPDPTFRPGFRVVFLRKKFPFRPVEFLPDFYV